MPYQESDDWYFGDYLGRLPGKSYSLLLYFIILLLFVQIALETEPSLDTESANVLLTFSLEIIEIFFISDYIGKLANSWSRLEYTFNGLMRSLFARAAIIDFVIVFLLLTDIVDNASKIVIGAYVVKAIQALYFSSFQRVIRRIRFIVCDSPAYTFFPLVLLGIVTYVLAFFMYQLERFNNPEHFGSIFRAFWFSMVTMTTIGYGDVTPSTAMGKSIAIIFGLSGIVCVALLTANILEANSKFNQLDSMDSNSNA
ncbi:MAG: ion channel [Cyanobacteriota bacterium]|nr:ion channel [Cyanobacteriota bacterium]